MQFAHPRLLITSSLPLRFSSLSSVSPPFPPFPRRFSAGSLFFSGSSTGFPFFRWFLRFSVSPPVPPVLRRFSVLLRFPSLSALSQARCTAGGSHRCCDGGRNRGSLGGERCGSQSGGRCGGLSGGRNRGSLRRAVPHFWVFRVQLWRKSFEWADFQQSCTAFRTKYGTARPGMHRYDLFYIHLQKTS